MFKFAFVILHYNSIDETLKCVQSIQSDIDAYEYLIVIVDNKSPNCSGVNLLKKYKDSSNVRILLNEENLGFAKGNNVGINYARNIYKADFVIVLNNDTYLIQKDFCSVIEKEWNRSYFAVMGPKITNLQGENQNPIKEEIRNLEEVNYYISRYKKGRFLYYWRFEPTFANFKNLIKKIIGYKKTNGKSNDSVRQENVKLHGCCYVFSPRYFEYFSGFDARTFMYVEEDILLYELRRKRLLTVYNPNLKIFHAERVSTKSVTKSERGKMLFAYKEGIKSLYVLKSIMLENEN